MGVHRFARITAAMTLLLLIAGGLVTSIDAGLSVPDWPLSYGTLFPSMVGGIVYEHTHRVIAAVVGLMIAVLVGWLWRKEPRRWVRRLGYGALGAVLAQVILGGLTVLLVLPPPLSIAHACLGQLVFCLVVSLALVTSPSWRQRQPDVGDSVLRRLCLITTSLMFLQLLLGAMIRHLGQALAMHMSVGAVVWVMTARVIWRLTRKPRRDPRLFRVASLIAIAVNAQVLLGLLVVTSHQQAALATAHVALGALILAASCVLTLLVLQLGDRQQVAPTPRVTPELVA